MQRWRTTKGRPTLTSNRTLAGPPCSRQGSGPKGDGYDFPLARLWANDDGQDIAEYAVMLAVILVIAVGTIRLIGSNANKVFSQVASAVQ